MLIDLKGFQHYKKPIFHPNDYKELEARSRKTFNVRQDWALKELYAWRDRSARTQDESLRYILPDHMLLQMADVLPRSARSFWVIPYEIDELC